MTDSVFYQIFPDRFARSTRLSKDGLNLETWDSPPTVHGFKGGDLYGVLEHLDYLQDLGINAMYLTPVFASATNHRYHTYDYYNVDPLLGGNQALTGTSRRGACPQACASCWMASSITPAAVSGSSTRHLRTGRRPRTWIGSISMPIA